MEMTLNNLNTNEGSNTNVNIRTQRTNSHYTITDKVKQAHMNLVKNLNTEVNNNKIYWEEFTKNSGKSQGSLVQYKSTIFNFMESINKDICLITKEDVDFFLTGIYNQNTKSNKIAHIKSILDFAVKNNTAGCLDRISKETLILIISL